MVKHIPLMEYCVVVKNNKYEVWTNMNDTYNIYYDKCFLNKAYHHIVMTMEENLHTHTYI